MLVITEREEKFLWETRQQLSYFAISTAGKQVHMSVKRARGKFTSSRNITTYPVI